MIRRWLQTICRPGVSGWWEILAAGFLPGALAGTQLAGLLFFLNPHLPFTAGPVVRGILVYGSLLGALTLALHLPLTWNHPRRALRFLPWTLTAGFALACLVDWVHASHFAYYLPSGINARLIKAALWLSLAALICFYTALLHSLHRRPYGFRSRLGFALLFAASIYVMVERREAYHPRPVPTPRASRVEDVQRPRLLVVGLEGATLDVILPLAEQGNLPFFSTVLREGVYGRLGSLQPARRSALWTSLATGKYPFKHGILGESELPASFLAPAARLKLLPVGIGFSRWGTLGVRPELIDSRSRKALTLWEILARLGVPTALVGWPATAPAPGELRYALSDRFFADQPDEADSLPPTIRAAALGSLQGQEEADARWWPHFGVEPPQPVREALDQDLWRQSVALSMLESDPSLRALFLVLPGLGQVSQRFFGGYSAVQFEGVNEPAYQEASQWLTGFYLYLDAFLMEAWNALEGPRLLAVVSAYGVEAPGGLRRVWGEIFRRRSLEGYFDEAPDGVLLLYGEGIRSGSLLTQSSLLDLKPTLLYGLGFPIARDLDGRVLTQAFGTEFLDLHPLTFIPSYETLDRISGSP